MNITVEQLECLLMQLRTEFLGLEEKFDASTQPNGVLLEKMEQLSHTIELLENEINRRSIL